jgi:methylthioribose-1-phosphate isomerase
LRTIWWEDGKVVLIDQTKLPASLDYVKCSDAQRVAEAIRSLEIRGAPAIGIAVAMGLALTAYSSRAESVRGLVEELEASARLLRATRPTAWNLFWAADRILSLAYGFEGDVEGLKKAVVEKALSLAEEDIAANKAMGVYGASLLRDGDVVGTVCNAGWLATAGEYGTALGAVKAAREQGKRVSVLALETRPVLQGARLTAWELKQDGIPVRVIVDGAVGYCVSKGLVDLFIVGADRIMAKEGCYVFNKVGTYTAAIVARRHDVPFYVAAPLSTFDFTHRVEEVIIEERDSREVAEVDGKRVVAEGVEVFNPAFDITPPGLVDGIITERGILYPPYPVSLAALMH